MEEILRRSPKSLIINRHADAWIALDDVRNSIGAATVSKTSTIGRDPFRSGVERATLEKPGR